MTKVLKTLVRLRTQRMTASELARKMGVSRQQIYNIESGRQGHPSIKTLEKYAKAIGARIVVLEQGHGR